MRSPDFATRWLALGFLCASLLAPMVEPVAGQRFGEEITVEEIEIPVHVVRKGSSVAGLTREDFQVFVDGEHEEIVSFEVLERPVIGEPEAPEVARDSFSPVTDVTSPRRLLILFDLLFAEQHKVLRALGGVRRMLHRQIEPGALVALAYVARSGAKILVGFTRDRNELELGLDVVEAMLKPKAKYGQASLTRLQRYLGDEGEGAPDLAELGQRYGSIAALAFGGQLAPGVDVAHLVSPAGTRTFDPTADLDSGGPQTRFPEDDPSSTPDLVTSSVMAATPEEIGAKLAQSVEGSFVLGLAREIEGLAVLLRDVPNPKELLYLSQGFPSSILESFDHPDQTRVLRHLRDMHKALIAGGWILHSINIGGIPTAGPDVTVESPGGTPASISTTASSGHNASALFYMANETGGQVTGYYNRIDHAARDLLNRLRVTYLLTIRPNDAVSDSRRHDIEVRLKHRKRGTRVYYRPAYYGRGGDESSNPLEAEMQAMREWLLGDEVDNPLAAVVHAGQVREAESAKRVRLMIEIPGPVIIGERSAGIARLEIRILVLDSGGGVQATWSRRVSLDLAEVGHRLRDRRLCLRTELEVPPGPHRLRALVRLPTQNMRSLLRSPIAESWSGLPSGAPEECLEPRL